MKDTKILNDEMLLKYIKEHGIDINEYKYIAVSTKKTKYGVKNTEALDNPFLWNNLVSTCGTSVLDYLISDTGRVHITIPVVEGIIFAKKPIRSYYEKILDIVKDKQKEENIGYVIDILCLNCISANKLFYLKTTVKYMKKNKIKPCFKEYGNINNGNGLVEAAKIGNEEIIEFLLSNGANPSFDEGFSFLSAMKHANYKIALLLVKAGCDPHVKNDLGFKLLQRNDKMRLIPSKENKESYEILCNIYTRS